MPQLSYVHGASGTPFIGDTIGVHFDRIAERFGAQEVYHFANYGHWLPLEAPDELAERLSSFFGPQAA